MEDRQKAPARRGDFHYVRPPLLDATKYEGCAHMAWLLRKLKDGKREDVITFFKKWDLVQNTVIHEFEYSGDFRANDANSFVTRLMNSRAFLSKVRVSAGHHRLRRVSPVNSVSISELSCRARTIEFFDRLSASGIVGPKTGAITQAAPYTFAGLKIADHLRALLLDPKSVFYSAFSQPERREFMFLLFKYVVLGGSAGDPEDSILPYVFVVKTLYRTLVRIKKHSGVTSHVYRLNSADSYDVFPGESPLHAAFFVVEPKYKRIVFWYHAHTSPE